MIVNYVNHKETPMKTNSERINMDLVQLSRQSVIHKANLERWMQMGMYPLVEPSQRNSNCLLHCKVLAVALLFIVFFSTTSCYAIPTDKINDHRFVSLDLKDKDFIQVLSSVSDQMGIDIVFSGEQPAAKKDIKIASVPLDRAIVQIVRRYDIENHAVVYNTEGGAEKIKLYGYTERTSTSPSFSTANLAKSIELDDTPVTREQLDLLAAQNQQIKVEEDNQSLTSEQLTKLEEKSEIIEADEEVTPLLAEQKRMFKERNEESKSDFYDNQEPLQKEKLMLLQNDELERGKK